MTDRERPEDEHGQRGAAETPSNLDATLEGLPDDPAPPMPHLRPIRDLLAAEREAGRIAPPPEVEHPPESPAAAAGVTRDAPGPPPAPLAPWRESDPSADAPESPAETSAPPDQEPLAAPPPATSTDSQGAEQTPPEDVASPPVAAGEPEAEAQTEPALEPDAGAESEPAQTRAPTLAPVAIADAPEASPAGEPAPPPRRSPAVPITAHFVVLVVLATAVMLAFVLIEPTPRWLLLVGAGVVILGMDGVLRAAWREPFASGETTAPYLFLPALYVLGAPIIVEHNIPAPAVILAGLGLGAGFAAIAIAELISVRPGAPEYPYARLIATAGAYFTLFALASMTYVFDAGLAWSLVVMAILGVMLGIEVLREGEIDPTETLVFALIVGFVLLQARWVLHYLPLEGYMAGLTLTLVFFFTTGLLHAHITRQFGAAVVVEYTGIAAAGFALVVAARATGLA